jgi:hypothetical protein
LLWTGVPVQPIALSYKQRHADPAWLHGIGMGHLFWRLMCQFHNSASLEFLPPCVAQLRAVPPSAVKSHR